MLKKEKEGDIFPWKVAWASCAGCPAGTDGGLCHHIFALLEILEFNSHGNSDSDQLPGPMSVTSQACSWGPRPRSIAPKRTMETVVEKSKMAGERKKKALACSLYEARGPALRRTTVERMASLYSTLPANSRLRGILPGNVTTSSLIMVNTAFGPSPLGSLLSYQLEQPPVVAPPPPPSPVPCQLPSSDRAPDRISRTIFPRLPFTVPDVVPALVKAEEPMPLIEAQKVEQATKGQVGNSEWRRYHTFTLTASNFRKVAVAKGWSDSLMVSLFASKDLSHVAAIRHGRENETVAVQAYCRKMAENGNQVEVAESGLVLHPRYKFLGASPDRVVFDPKAFPARYGLLEVKCPHRAFLENQTVLEACHSPDFCCQAIDGTAQLKPSHAYHYQVQGQMAVTGALWCDFVVWIRDSLFIQCVKFDKNFWVEKILQRLVEFHSLRMQPYLQVAVQCIGANMQNSVRNSQSYPDTVLEKLYPAEFCQARIDGRNGSAACTFIASGFVKQCLESPRLLEEENTRKEVLEKAMIEGNRLYDSLGMTGLLSADEVVGPLGLELDGEVFFRPNEVSSVQALLVAGATTGEERNVAGGVCVLHPYSIALVCNVCESPEAHGDTRGSRSEGLSIGEHQ